MLKNPPSPQYELEMISLEQPVPKDHLVRKVAKAIDFEFIRDEIAPLYCQDNGRPAVDPVRLCGKRWKKAWWVENICLPTALI